MKGKLIICLVVAGVLIVGIIVAVISTDLLRKGVNMNEQETKESWVIASEDELLGKYEKSDLLFKRMEIGNMIVYGHHRKIDDAIVEGDRINYQFDKSTKELKKRIIHWRDDLPEHLPHVISKEEAESIAKSTGKGKIMNTSLAHTKLLYIASDSCWYSIEPTPENPCWIVYFADDKGYNIDVIIVDAVNGKILGHGVPFPSSGFSFSGPQDVPNCTGSWSSEWHQNAESWFNTMGYPTEAMLYPNEEKRLKATFRALRRQCF